MKGYPSRTGFSLIELIVSSVVITIIGAAAWSANSALMQANEVNRNNVIGINLLRKSQEEVRQVAQSNFDSIGQGSCQFGAANACGFEDITATFPGFTRSLAVVSAGSSEFKQITITVNWKEFERDRSLTSVLLLSRPSQSLPGNVMGLITNSLTGAPVGGADIIMTKVNPAQTLPTISSLMVTPAADGQNQNYSFLNPAGQFQMESGVWTLAAHLNGYLDYAHPASIIVSTNVEQRINIQLIPVPDATITVAFNPIGAPSGFNAPFGKVGLYKAGTLINEVDSAGSNSFTVSFTDTKQQCFTVATRDLFKSGYAGGFSCSAPQTQDPRGWSSAVVADNGALSCSRPWNGSSSSGVDRICVSPGESKTVNVPLNPVKVRTITGFVRDQDGGPLASVPLRILWHDGGDYPWPGKVTSVSTNSSGFYSAVVPALQELFSNTSSNYLRLTASASVPVKRCCDVVNTTTVSRTIRPGPLFVSNSLSSQNITLSTDEITQRCGDAKGIMRDAKTTNLLSGVSVNLSRSTSTNTSGAYLYQCASGSTPPYSIVARSYTLSASRSGYYSYSSAGNSVYRPLNSAGTVAVNADKVNNVGDISLWPQGFGRLNISVSRQGSSSSISNAVVAISGPTNRSLSSGSGGVYVFNNILETWPVPEVVGNSKFNQSSRNYSVQVTHPAYENATQSGITLKRNETKNVTINMVPKGGM